MTHSLFRHIDSVFWKRQPVQLTFFLTRRCNARCPFCFYLSTDTEPENDAPELSLLEIEKMASSLGRLLWLAFSGGEIFLRDDLVDVVRVFYRRNRPAIILLPTNGLLPDTIYRKTTAILEHCPKSVVTVKLSLDGLEPLHDSLRGVPGAFRKTLETYRLLTGLVEKYDNFELGMNTVFCAANQDDMEEIIGYVNTLDGIRTHTVSLIRGNVRDRELKNVDMRKYHDTISMMEANLKNRQASRYRFRGARLKSAQDILQRRLIHRVRVEQRQVVPCYAGQLTLVVTETGDVYPCESFYRKLGNVREAGCDLQQILRSGPAAEAVAAIQQGECFCTHECYMMMNILFNARVYPALLREFIALKGGD
jgi:radical SAM protein with 4Fe4S-binding SPASM domain